MASIHTRPLTAQEAFEQEGFVPLASTKELRIGQVVAADMDTLYGIPAGSKLVVSGDLSVTEFGEYERRCGWSKKDRSPSSMYPYSYKAVAE